MRVQISTDPSQRIVFVRLIEGTLSAETSFVLEFYDSQSGVALYTYTFSAGEIIDMKQGIVSLNTANFTTFPVDGYYYVKLVGSSQTSEWDSVSFTLSVRSNVYSLLSQINVYTPDYHISTFMYEVKMLLDEMEQIQNLEFANQKKVDFDVRMDQITSILSK